HHVTTEDTASKVKILFSNGDSAMATVLRSNAEYDLAILKLDKPGPYKYFPVDTVTHEIPIGDDVFAIGTPESIFLGQTLTKGIISGERSAGNKTIIQTDVSINPGNSGGALVNTSGHLLGIVNAKMKGEGVQGIGFAIPASYIDEALKVQFSK
ncbi:MAG TPA: trypsin-like peptidase domain-containing protein, partial [Bacteroidia bacterium]|nr:trypsin-like peptidase domain-containing protein [Bacteroidia bacterium]